MENFERLELACSLRYGNISKASLAMGKSKSMLGSYKARGLNPGLIHTIEEELYINRKFLLEGKLPIFTDEWSSTELRQEEGIIRLKNLLEQRDNDYERFLEQIGYSDGEVRHWIVTPRKSTQIGKAIAEEGINLDLILNTREDANDYIQHQDSQQVNETKKHSPEYYKMIPFVQNPADLGTGQKIFEEDVKAVPFFSYLFDELKLSDPFMMTTRGNSMRPHIHDGDLVIADKAKKPKPGDIVVCRYQDDVLCKVFWPKDNVIILSSYNASEYGPILITDVEELNIIGVVAKTIRPFGKWRVQE